MKAGGACEWAWRNPGHIFAQGSRRSLGPPLQATINRFIDDHNNKSEPFVWKVDPARVVAAVQRGKQALESIQWQLA